MFDTSTRPNATVYVVYWLASDKTTVAGPMKASEVTKNAPRGSHQAEPFENRADAVRLSRSENEA